jgi:hypothetical protein
MNNIFSLHANQRENEKMQTNLVSQQTSSIQEIALNYINAENLISE